MTNKDITTKRASPDLRYETGPFDIIGDVHGCATELLTLLADLGYLIAQVEGADEGVRFAIVPPHGRRAVFVGDLVDRGPRSPDVLRIVMDMVAAGAAFAVPGNHDIKFLRWLQGQSVKVSHGLDRTIAQFESESAQFRARVATFLSELPCHVWLQGGALAVAHAGVKEHMLGASTGAVSSFCLYGETSGEADEFGLPIRYHWAAEYGGATEVVYGHTPVPEPDWVNNTICIDTGCCFGGKLSALRWPERVIASVSALQTYVQPVRAFGHPPMRPGGLAKSAAT